jgi:hypothetical protein
LRRPGEEIPDRPRLRPRRPGSGRDEAPSGPAKRAGTLYGESGAGGDAEESSSAGENSDEDATPRKVVMPPLEGRYPYATYRSAPADEKAEKEELKAVSDSGAERRISTGFVLGIALVVVVLLGGIWLARLGNKVQSLQNRVARLEEASATEAP